METVVSAVIHAAAFMEAMVNELFADAHDEHGIVGEGYLAPLEPNTVRLMSDWWAETNEGRDRVLSKYSLLLSFANCEPLSKGTEPFQSADLLTKLRNEIVHYRPVDISHNTVLRSERLLSHKFPASRLLSEEQPWWPYRALGAGCARWAHESATSLADEVATRLGIIPNYQRMGHPRHTDGVASFVNVDEDLI